MGNFNLTIENKHLEELLNLVNLKSLNSSPTCFQSMNPTCINLILTNQEDLFSNSKKCEVWISHYHLLVSTILNKKILKGSTEALFIEIIRSFKKINLRGI